MSSVTNARGANSAAASDIAADPAARRSIRSRRRGRERDTTRGNGIAAEQNREAQAERAGRDRHGQRRGEAEEKCAAKKKLLALRARGLRHQHRQTRADARQRDAGDHLDHRGELRPQRDKLGAAAQRENLVDGRAARVADRRDRERQQEFGSVDL